MPTITTSQQNQSCGRCNLGTSTCIVCDSCKIWWCNDCINWDYNRVLTPCLYEKLKLIKEFSWRCSKCSSQNLLQQLLQNDVCTKDELISCKCNVKAMEAVAEDMLSGPTEIYDDSKQDATSVKLVEMISTVVHNQMRGLQTEVEKIRFAEKEEREQRKQDLQIIMQALQVKAAVCAETPACQGLLQATSDSTINLAHSEKYADPRHAGTQNQSMNSAVPDDGPKITMATVPGIEETPKKDLTELGKNAPEDMKRKSEQSVERSIDMGTNLLRLNSIIPEGAILPEKDFTFAKFCERVSISGLSDWYAATSCCVKAFWMSTIIGFTILLICNMDKSIKEYYYSPIKTSISFIRAQSMELPEIYICPSNYLNFNLHPCIMGAAAINVSKYLNIFNPFDNKGKWSRYLAMIHDLKTGKARPPLPAIIDDATFEKPLFNCFGDIKYNLYDQTISEFKRSLSKVSMTPYQFIEEESQFQGQILIPNVTQILDKSYGICYLIKVDKPQNVKGSGLQLHLDLHIDDREKYLPNLTRRFPQKRQGKYVDFPFPTSVYAGAAMKIGNPVDLIDEGEFFVGAGQTIKVNLGLNFEKLVNIDYGATPQSCLSKEKYPAFSILQGGYTSQRCEADCFLYYVYKHCVCIPILDPRELKTEYRNATACNKVDTETCVHEVSWIYQNQIPSCSSRCKMPCNLLRYTADISHMPTISTEYLGDEKFFKSAIDLEIGYSDLEYRMLVQSQATSLAQLVSDIGGQAGLYLGASLFSVIQIIALLSAWCYKATTKQNEPKEIVGP